MSLNGTCMHEPSGTVTVPRKKKNAPLHDVVHETLSTYFDQLDGTTPNDLYKLVVEQVEYPLLESVMSRAGGNQTKAAQMLGISRSTLRKKLAHYAIE